HHKVHSFPTRRSSDLNMDYKIVEKGPFKIVGMKKRVPIQFEGVNEEIVKLAESITPEQREKLRSYGNIEPYQVVNASYNFDEGRDRKSTRLNSSHVKI